MAAKTSFLIFCACAIAVFADDSGLVKKPSEAEIFGLLNSNTDWTDVLYLCDFFKTSTFSCNVTVDGAEHLKNSSRKSSSTVAMPGLKQPKFVIQNVTGSWSADDGVMKPNYVSVDYLNIVAKCFFRVEYYECFGVPRCDGRGGMSECHGGEPWRGQYEGAPNVGFKANITNMAQESSPVPQQRSEPPPPPPVSANQTLIGANPMADGLAGSSNLIADTDSGNGQTLITLTNSSGTFTSTGNGDLSGPIEVPANGGVSIVKVSPTIEQNGTTSGGVQVSSFSSFSSGGSGPTTFNNNVNPFAASGFPDFGFPSFPRRQRPISAVSRADNQNLTDSGSPAGPTALNDNTNCSSQGDFSQSLRCLIQNFQKTVFSSIMTSFQNPSFQPLRFNWNPIQQSPFRFASRQQQQQQQPSQPQQMQSQSMGSMFQSQQQQQQPLGRSFFGGGFGGPRFGGFKVLIVPDNGQQFQADTTGDDDTPAWMASPFRK